MTTLSSFGNENAERSPTSQVSFRTAVTRFKASATCNGRSEVFVDTSYIVGLTDRRDQWHKDALRVANRVPKHPSVTNLVLAESVTIVGSRSGGKSARILYDYFVDECRLIFVDAMLQDSAIVQHTRFDGKLSLADCATVAAMVKASDTELASFDTDFDKVAGVNRLS
ncbi:MAG: PIN domain-containing protein [Thermoplasmata archaeon]|nr:PIN domain-containing protein [Thermoplasmata archaeon]